MFHSIALSSAISRFLSLTPSVCSYSCRHIQHKRCLFAQFPLCLYRFSVFISFSSLQFDSCCCCFFSRLSSHTREFNFPKIEKLIDIVNKWKCVWNLYLVKQLTQPHSKSRYALFTSRGLLLLLLLVFVRVKSENKMVYAYGEDSVTVRTTMRKIQPKCSNKSIKIIIK